METVLFTLLAAGGGLAAVGWIWLWLRAWRQHWLWGLGGFVVVPLLIYILIHGKSARPPLWLMLLGLALVGTAFGINLYERYYPDLGEIDRIVDGERHLTLTGWNRTDYSFLALQRDVVVLQMANPDVTDAVVELLRGWPKLKRLDVANSAISDQGLQALHGLGTLEGLVLSQTRISEAGLQQLLEKLPNLRQLDVRGVAVDPELLRIWRDGAPGRRVLPSPPRRPAATPTATAPSQ
ncbi:MAG TPA: hypothetical protein PKC45_01440 [Gemmatales bacterium]|nr:hypothetical protein [Gemmatales bacterium]